MLTYVFYDQKTGEIIHIHREYHPTEEEKGKETPLSREALLEEVRAFLPENVAFDILVTAERPMPVRGYQYCVDLATRKLMLVERPPRSEETQR